jgi:hypothetical protein
MNWLEPYVIKYVIEASAVQLKMLNGEVLEGMVNGIRMTIYRDDRPLAHWVDLCKNKCTILVYYSRKNTKRNKMWKKKKNKK